jgi:hypothetical protein
LPNAGKHSRLIKIKSAPTREMNFHLALLINISTFNKRFGGQRSISLTAQGCQTLAVMQIVRNIIYKNQ